MRASFEPSSYVPVHSAPGEVFVPLHGVGRQLQRIGFDESVWREPVLRLLKDALNKELWCVTRYNRESIIAYVQTPEIMECFLRSSDELTHACALARHIVELGGELDHLPRLMARLGQTSFSNRQDLKSMISENLIAQYRIIVRYTEIIAEVDPRDEVARRLLTRLMDEERAHADELISWLVN